ncbi:hypothetical protein BGW42_007945, partial [Actinomortierella wolfii]
HFLYSKNPSPFITDDLSEAWWARKAWHAWLDLLNDVDGIFMVDGEKMGVDSSQRKNMHRQYSAEESTRKRTGRKLDLVCCDEIQKHDWMVLGRMRTWDTNSSKFLKEVEHIVVRGRGFTTIQLRPANSTSYVLLMQRLPRYVLPAEMGGLRSQFRGLVKILQIRAAMRTTIGTYRELQKATPNAEDDELNDLQRETDVS